MYVARLEVEQRHHYTASLEPALKVVEIAQGQAGECIGNGFDGLLVKP